MYPVNLSVSKYSDVDESCSSCTAAHLFVLQYIYMYLIVIIIFPVLYAFYSLSVSQCILGLLKRVSDLPPHALVSFQVSLSEHRLCVSLSLSRLPAEARHQHADYSNSRPCFQKAPARRRNESPALWASNIKPCLLLLWIIQARLEAADHPGNSQEN